MINHCDRFINHMDIHVYVRYGFLCRPTAFCSTCWSRVTSEGSPWGKQRICSSNSGSAHFHVSWLSDFIFYPKPLYKSFHQSFFYSFTTILPSKSGITRLQDDFALDPIISPFDFHSQTFVTWLWENYDYNNVSWEMIYIYDLTLSKMRGGGGGRT